MKSSRYNIFVDCPETGEVALYNTLYGSLTLWSHNEIGTVKHILAEPNQFSEENVIKAVLIEQQHLIDDYTDEITIIENRKISGIKDENRLDVVVMPTLECNFACVYCYETHRPSKMTDETEAAIKKWIGRELPKYKVIMLHWFGGEPLSEYQRVISISQYATDLADKLGVSCFKHITTNGYLLNKKRCKELINTGIYDFQITVDGSPEIHNQLRILRNGKGTFKRLFENINMLARTDEQVKISLRVNFNHNNLHSIPYLLEMFPMDVRAHLRVVYEPIFGHCSLNATDNLPSKEISEAMINYYKLAAQLGYDVVLGQASQHIYTGKLVYCFAERENQFIINYTGDVYKCSVSQFNPKERVGYIRTDGMFIKQDDQWNQWVDTDDLFEEKCYSCVYLPLCMGGCRKTRLRQKETGSYCSLFPTNTSYILKQVAFGQFEDIIRRESEL
ncbi:MAG: radical SAM protein [bacterium]